MMTLAQPVAPAAPSPGVEAAIAFLAAAQIDTGFSGAPTQNVVEAVGQWDIDVRVWPTPERSAFSQLSPYGTNDTLNLSRMRVAHAVATAGYDPRDVHGEDLIAAIQATFDGTQFGSRTLSNDDTWAILSLRAAGVPATDEQVQKAALFLEAARAADGGWSFTVSGLRGNTDLTGMTLVALTAAGRDVEGDLRASTFLEGTYDAASGGHDDHGGAGVNCQSTLWAVHGYHALGVEPRAKTLDYLARLDTGAGFTYKEGGRANTWCTAEALLFGSGARYPLAGYVPAAVRKPECHAREAVTIGVSGPFPRTSVTWGDGEAGATRTFERAGEYPFRYHARGSGGVARGADVLTCLSARPVVPLFPDEVRLPHQTPLLLDLAGAYDPDGAIADWEIDWGDGNVTGATPHAYPLPGAYAVTIRARDDSNVWSHPAHVNVTVTNAAPVLSLPARVVADRIAGVALNVTATDPEGDAVALSWSYADLSGEGAPRFVPTAAGNHSLVVRATDAFGAEANATTTVDVVNLPPIVAFLPGDEPAAEARDPDGPTPGLLWTVDGAPVESPIRLTPGEHVVRVVATDADGATAEATRTFTARASGEPSAPPTAAVAPEIVAFDAHLVAGEILGTFMATPQGARAILSWQSDAGAGAREVGSPFTIALDGATWATARLAVEHEGQTTFGDAALLVAPQPEAPPAPTPRAPAPIILASEADPPPQPETETALEPASFTEQTAARSETPFVPSWAIVLLAATLGMLVGSRARSRRRARR